MKASDTRRCIYAATKNPGKLRELQNIFARFEWVIDSYASYSDVTEGEASYAENAALKARALRAQLHGAGIRAAVLGDDSGLEVAALGNRPGVLSARYGSPGATWAQRRDTLLSELRATASRDRSARFVCALHFIEAGGHEVTVERDVRGEITLAGRGEGGFSYDAIFRAPAFGVTFAELSESAKNAISHRARAAAALVEAVTADPRNEDRA